MSSAAWIALLTEHRGRLVAKYRVNPQVWPDGIGSWYKPEDWGPTDDKGIARPVNNRPDTAIVNKPEAVNTEAVNTAKEALDRAAYMREYMRKRRAREHAPNAPVSKGDE